MLQPVVRRTWAPQGQTPIQYSWDRHDRLSVISAITLPPLRCRLGLYFQIHSDNINFEKVMGFITLLRRHLRRKFILVLDRYIALERQAVFCPRRKAALRLATLAPFRCYSFWESDQQSTLP